MIKNNRHAFLIMAHNNFYILERLIELLDNIKNDIFIHIDIKAKGMDFNKLSSLTKHSNIYFVKRKNVQWGGYSQINCELALLKTAVKIGYGYYHLISGCDMPLKPLQFIHEFFDNNYGCEFIHFDSLQADKRINERVMYYYFFQEYKNRLRLISLPLKLVDDFLVWIQKKLNINRLKNLNIKLQKGSNWFSITDELAGYVISKEEWIKKTFKYTACCDELFLQTLVINSYFKDRLYNKGFDNNYLSIMRYIDWNRGIPYVWRLKDFNELIESPYIFARKFDQNIDIEIVMRIYKYIKDLEKSSDVRL